MTKEGEKAVCIEKTIKDYALLYLENRINSLQDKISTSLPYSEQVHFHKLLEKLEDDYNNISTFSFDTK